MALDFEKHRQRYLGGTGDNDSDRIRTLSIPVGTRLILRILTPEGWDWPIKEFGIHYRDDDKLPIEQNFVCPRGHRFFNNVDSKAKCDVCGVGSQIYKEYLERVKKKDFRSKNEQDLAKKECGPYFPNPRAYVIVIVERILDFPEKDKDREYVENIPLKVPLWFGITTTMWKYLVSLLFARDEKGNQIETEEFSGEYREPWDITSIEEGAFFIYEKTPPSSTDYPTISFKEYPKWPNKSSLYDYSLGNLGKGKMTKKEVKAMFEDIPDINNVLFFPTAEEISDIAAGLLSTEDVSGPGTDKYGSGESFEDKINKSIAQMSD